MQCLGCAPEGTLPGHGHSVGIGVNNSIKMIKLSLIECLFIYRQPDGTLQSCDHDIRKRLNQVCLLISMCLDVVMEQNRSVW